MRAGRLINMLLILQRRGRVTAATLSREFGVSERTVLRDVQALHEAGIPIFTSQGAGGGIELVAGYRTILTGLASDESAVLLLVGQPALAELLGLAAPVASARRKVLEALPGDAGRRAAELDEWFLLDPYDAETGPPPMLDRLATAIRKRVVVELVFAESSEEVQPLGLVNKAGRWYLVQLSPGGPESRSLLGLQGVRTTRTPVVRPADFDLARFWAATTSVGGPIITVSPAT